MTATARSTFFSKQRRAFITGGARGIGRAIAQDLEQNGCEVICPPRAELDLSDLNSIERFLDRHDDLEVDILINNAGINFPSLIENVDSKNWQDTFQVNLTAPFMLSRHFSAGMRKRKWGRIINVSSVFSFVTKEGRSIYTATKAALNGFTRTCAVEWGKDGVLVNALCPGYIDTALTRQNNTEAQIAKTREQIPLGRLANTDEIAKMVSFMCSDLNSYMTGQCVVVDGGFSLK